MNSLAKKLLEDPAIREAANSSPLFADLVASAKRVELDETTFFVVEGDLLLDMEELALYALRRESPARAAEFGEQDLGEGRKGLVAMVEDGLKVRWPDGAVLTYCVERETFGDAAGRYADIVARVRQAASDWQSICGVAFRHETAADAPGASRSHCLFKVRLAPGGDGQFLAVAFFPNDAPSRRVLHVDPTFFNDHGFDKTGVLRHELGHVLGFRHEHIRSGAPPECPGESTAGTLNLTLYDPKSVMHYFCGGVGSRELRFSPEDIAGAQAFYGPPRP
jgi:hypothetical protein